ncbi:MAG: hypothetical protein ACE5Q6_10230 [Dehalococcoidia bacterium]
MPISGGINFENPFLGENPFSSFMDDAQTSLGSSDPFLDILEFEPNIAFQGALHRANLTPNLFRRFQSDRNRIFGQYQALLDEQIRAGMLPSARFADFIQNYDFQREAMNLSPSERFGDISRFAPRTTFLR